MNGSRTAAWILRALLDSPDKAGPSQGGEQAIVDVARAGVVTVRLAEALGGRAPTVLVKAADAERARIANACDLIRLLAVTADRHRLAYCFMKAFQHESDMGHDIDILVEDVRYGRLVKAELHPRPLDSGSLGRFAGKLAYEIPGYSTPVEIHQGRVGHLGEHQWFFRELLARRVMFDSPAGPVAVPAAEDRLVLQVIQRIYGHFSIRLGDVLATIALLKDVEFGLVRKAAATAGVLDGAAYYLSAIDQILETALGHSVIEVPDDLRRSIKKLSYERGAFRFPILRVSGPLYARKVANDLSRGRLADALRTVSLPAAAVSSLAAGATRKWRRRPPA